MSLFDTAVNVTLKGYTKSDGSSLSDGERQAIANHLRSRNYGDSCNIPFFKLR